MRQRPGCALAEALLEGIGSSARHYTFRSRPLTSGRSEIENYIETGVATQ